jgi:hypothetical protein
MCLSHPVVISVLVIAIVTATVVGITWQSESSMSHVRALWR